MLAIEQDQPLCSLEVMCLATTKSVVSCIHTEGVSFSGSSEEDYAKPRSWTVSTPRFKFSSLIWS